MSNKRRLFHVIGMIIVSVWLIMMASLHHKVESLEGFSIRAKTITPTRLKSYEREWKEIYHKGRKIGYSVSIIKPMEDDYIIQEDIYLRLNLLGMPRTVHTVTQCRVDSEFYLKDFNFNMSSGIISFHIKGKVQGNYLIIKRGGKRGAILRRIRLSKRLMMGSAVGAFFRTHPVKVNETYQFPLFDPATMAQTNAIFRVVGRGKISINNITYDAIKVETTMWGKPVVFWIDKEDGSTLKEEGLMGFTIVRSSAKRAPANMEPGMEQDFYDMMAISIDRALPDPKRLKSIKLKVKAVKGGKVDVKLPSDKRQSFMDGILKITKESIPRKSGYRIPYNKKDKKMSRFLRSEFNIESDNAEIKEKAMEIIGLDRDPISVCRKMLKWVNKNIKKMPVVVVPSALEVLNTKVGDCNELATLLTALLRSIGIPSRICAGLVYSRSKFYYHAWNEAYVGKWISIDPTLNQMPVDPSHIKITQGNLEKQMEIAPFIGSLKFEVLDYEYD